MIENRYKKHIFKLKIDDHPIYIKNKLSFWIATGLLLFNVGMVPFVIFS